MAEKKLAGVRFIGNEINVGHVILRNGDVASIYSDAEFEEPQIVEGVVTRPPQRLPEIISVNGEAQVTRKMAERMLKDWPFVMEPVCEGDKAAKKADVKAVEPLAEPIAEAAPTVPTEAKPTEPQAMTTTDMPTKKK